MSAEPYPGFNQTYPLWEHLSREHQLNLVESELAEIIRLAQAIDTAETVQAEQSQSPSVCSACNGTGRDLWQACNQCKGNDG